MTTEIIVNAHCSDDKEVKVRIESKDFEHGPEITTLQNNDSQTFYAHDDRDVSVKEVEKKE